MTRLSRRGFLGGLAALTATCVAPPAWAHNDAGLVNPPEPAPEVDVTLHDGRTLGLGRLLAGHTTALQLMFTSCGMTCPIQGAVFAAAAAELGDRVPTAQWLSITIDPGRDTPAALDAWLARFGRHPRWRAARPSARDAERLLTFLRSRTQGPDRHTAQVYFFDRRSRLAMRSVDFPPKYELLRVLTDLDRRG